MLKVFIAYKGEDFNAAIYVYNHRQVQIMSSNAWFKNSINKSNTRIIRNLKMICNIALCWMFEHC